MLFNLFISNMKKIISISFIIAVLISCTSSKKIHEKMEETEDLPFYNEKLKTLKIEGSMDVEMPSMSQGASIEVRLKEQSEMGMNVFGPFGIEVAKLYASNDKFIFFNMFQGEAYQGQPSSENLNKVANISLSFKDLISIMRCEIPSFKKKFIKYKDEDESKIYINPDKSKNIEKATIDKFGLLKKYEQSDLNGKKIFEVNFSNYRNVDKFKLAHLVKIIFPQIGGNLTIEVENYFPNQEINNLELKIPSSIKIKEIK
jgi:hypothetical protein